MARRPTFLQDPGAALSDLFRFGGNAKAQDAYYNQFDDQQRDQFDSGDMYQRAINTPGAGWKIPAAAAALYYGGAAAAPYVKSFAAAYPTAAKIGSSVASGAAQSLAGRAMAPSPSAPGSAPATNTQTDSNPGGDMEDYLSKLRMQQYRNQGPRYSYRGSFG